PRHADAVTAHLEDALRALGVEHRRVHRRAVLCPELKHLPDLDAALKNEASAAARTGIALAGDAQVGEFHVGEIARLHHADEMLISLVRASDAVGEPGERAIGDTTEAGLQADRAGEADGRAGDARDDVLRRERDRLRAESFLELRLRERMVAAHHRHDCVAAVYDVDEALHEALRRHAEKRAHLFDAALPGRCDLAERRCFRRAAGVTLQRRTTRGRAVRRTDRRFL